MEGIFFSITAEIPQNFHGVFLKFFWSLKFLWNIYKITFKYSSDFRGMSMKILWNFFLEYPRKVHKNIREFLLISLYVWNYLEVFMELYWTFIKLPWNFYLIVISVWNIRGNDTETRWIFLEFGIPVNYLWNLVEFLWNIHGIFISFLLIFFELRNSTKIP